MGYLHEGHLSLLRAARAECDVVVMSLFVNPTQFGPDEDLDRYPRDEERDLRLAAEAGADLVYAPPVEEVYPEGFATTSRSDGPHRGPLRRPRAARPRHFRGVTTVVAKLFNAVQPDVAYFGQKDAQQVAVIRRMARDLDFPVRIEALPIVREADGLAMSSRNAYLDPARRGQAAALSRALRAAERGRPQERLLGAGARTPARAELRPPASSPSTSRRATPKTFPRSTELGRAAGADRGRRPGGRRAADRQRGRSNQ